MPSQITDKLRGRKFNNFDDFRKTFWKEVGNDTELSRQFNSHNKAFLKKGYSPYSPQKEHVGNREKYEIHHIKFIKDGGEVYNFDNLRVITPKRHIEIHSNKGE
ncbi:HNH endonuclease signature motif containing protein [Photorhabdus khanii]|uniref:HNH endonuclease signature motif containing protein n=1 Tax=Photorhabdus khanii TaxID=1004150 RepID=UPI000907420E